MSETPLASVEVSTQHLLRALQGRKEALAWLQEHRQGLALFVRAVQHSRKAFDQFQAMTPREWDQLFEAIANEHLTRMLEDEQPDIHQVFQAARGDDALLAQLHKRKPSLARLAATIREMNERNLLAAQTEPLPIEVPGSAAADVGCLIGELHLSRGEYQKAVEAFSRALENQPSADAYEGRAKAYRGLAQRDEARAQEFVQD